MWLEGSLKSQRILYKPTLSPPEALSATDLFSNLLAERKGVLGQAYK